MRKAGWKHNSTNPKLTIHSLSGSNELTHQQDLAHNPQRMQGVNRSGNHNAATRDIHRSAGQKERKWHATMPHVMQQELFACVCSCVSHTGPCVSHTGPCCLSRTLLHATLISLARLPSWLAGSFAKMLAPVI
jgi:hypothetical protein